MLSALLQQLILCCCVSALYVGKYVGEVISVSLRSREIELKASDLDVTLVCSWIVMHMFQLPFAAQKFIVQLLYLTFYGKFVANSTV